jgi:tetratricopeptide (TPR) repeat protein
MSSDLGTPYAGDRLDEPATRSPACPACGRHSQAEAAFCAFCGTALVHQRVPGPPVFAAVAAAITGRSAYDVLHEVGGIFESLGAVFEGVSQAPATLVALFPPKEDAAVTAARAALDAAMACPDVRLGIDASEVTERSDQDAIWQYLIDRAAELQALARPGTIVPGDEILPLTEGAAVIEPLEDGTGTPSLRSIRDLVAAPAEPPGRPVDAEPADPVARPTPFVGRERELAELMGRLAAVRDEGRAMCVAVIGEVGAGRTRLVAEFANASAPDVRIVRLACEPDPVGGVGAWPIEELVERVAGLTGDETSADVRATLERLVGHLPEGDRIAERLAHVVSVDGASGAVDETTWAIRALFEAVFDGPAILVVDDVDRVSFGFSSFLADLARALNATPLLIVCSAGGEPVGVADTLLMAPFDVPTAERLVAARLDGADGELATAIVEVLGTNPLALEHGLSLLVETSALSRDTSGWALGPNPLPVFGSVEDVLDARLQALPADVRATAAVAAVWGMVVPAPPLLAFDDDAGSSTDIERQLAELVATGIFVAEGPTITFVHPLVRATAATGASPARAAEAHVRAARADLDAAGSRRRRRAGSAGSHLAEALQLRRDVAAEDPDRVDAIDLLGAAAEHAGEVGDAAGAAILERRMASLLEKDDPVRAELLFRAAAHEVETGRVRQAEAAINAAMAATVGVPGDRIDHHVRILRASLRASADRAALDAARAVADEAYERFAELDDGWGLACAAALRGQVHAARGHAAAVVEDLTEAAERARASQHPTEAARALRGIGRALLDGPMPVEPAIVRCERLRADAAGHPLAEQDLAGVLGVLLARRGRFDEARELIGNTIATIEGLVSDADLAVALHRAGVIGWLAGEFDAAEPPIQRALAAAAHARDDRLRATIAASWANLVLATEDRVEEAMALADVAETWATEPTALVGSRTARARALVRLGDVQRADTLGREAVSLAEQTDSTDLRANALLHLAEVLRLSGRPDEAQPFERRAFRLLDRKGASAQAAAVFRNLSAEGHLPPSGEDDVPPVGPDDEDPPAPEIVADPADAKVDASGPEPATPNEPTPAAALPPEPEAEAAPDEPGPVADDRPPPPPIAEAFAASSEAEKKKRGRFRR